MVARHLFPAFLRANTSHRLQLVVSHQRRMEVAEAPLCVSTARAGEEWGKHYGHLDLQQLILVTQPRHCQEMQKPRMSAPTADARHAHPPFRGR